MWASITIQQRGITVTLLEVKIDSRQVDAVISQAIARLKNPKPLMASISAELLSLTDESFSKQGQIGGQSWTPLAAATIAKRSKEGTWPGKMLVISSAGLAASIHSFHSDSKAGISSSKPYAAIQLFGGQAGRGQKVTIPSRLYMPITKDKELTPVAKDSIIRIAEQYFSF